MTQTTTINRNRSNPCAVVSKTLGHVTNTLLRLTVLTSPLREPLGIALQNSTSSAQTTVSPQDKN